MKSTILIKPDEHYSEKIEDMKYSKYEITQNQM